MLKIFEKIVDIKGKDKPSPTPAPHSIAPINKASKSISRILLLILKIPENVNYLNTSALTE